MILKNTDFFFYYKILINLINKVDNFKKTYFLLFFILLLSSSFFEMSILGFLYVLIKAFLDPGYYSGNFIFQFAVKLFNIKSSIEFINYLSFFFIIVCIFAGFVRIYFNYIATRLVYFFGKNIANSCYLKLIYQEYKSFFNNNTSSILSIFQKLQVMNNSIYNTIFIIYNFFTFLFIFLILFYINWVITISSTFVFCTLYLLIIYFFKKKYYITVKLFLMNRVLIYVL